jgi:hypothetical protein
VSGGCEGSWRCWSEGRRFTAEWMRPQRSAALATLTAIDQALLAAWQLASATGREQQRQPFPRQQLTGLDHLDPGGPAPLPAPRFAGVLQPEESVARLSLRQIPYRPTSQKVLICRTLWVDDWIRTGDRLDHNQDLYTLVERVRRGWDSNPRYAVRRTTVFETMLVFETAPFNHSGTPPGTAGLRS